MPIGDIEKTIIKEPIDNYYDVGSELGRGKFAIVKRCTQKSTGTHFAAKVLKKRRHGRSVRADILVEIDIMQQANGNGKQARIIKIYEVFESSHEFYIILELATGGELFRVIAIEPLLEERAREVVYQILEGVQHLHTLNIVHLDLKPENILLCRKNCLDIKIADFGLSVQVRAGQEMKNLVGTAEYVSPEILNFEPLSTYTDMWSIGALTYALMTGYSPFQGETHQETFLNVSMVDYDFDDEIFENVSSDAKDFIDKLLKLQPKKRLTAAACLQHPWMKARTNLNSSTSSLDSAVCVDSTEASPVSSASSSFGPAPSATTSTANTTSLSSLSKPEDVSKFSQHLSTEISSLATERIMADTKKTTPEDSPTSTASSTSTLREAGSSENLPALREAEVKRSPSPAAKREETSSKYSSDYGKRVTSPTSSLEGRYSSKYEKGRFDTGSSRYSSRSPSSSFEIGRSSRTTSMEKKCESKEISVSPTFKAPKEKTSPKVSMEDTPSAKSAVSASTADTKVSTGNPEVVVETVPGPKQEPPSVKTLESDTDYGSGSSRSSSLETTPTTKTSAVVEKAGGSRSRNRVSESYTLKSATLDRTTKLSRDRAARQMSDTSSASKTLNRRTEATPTSSYTSRSQTLDRKPRSNIADVASLDPATVESLERFERIKKRPITPEPVSPKVSESKLLQSPERHSRRKSEGNRPIGHVVGQLSKLVDGVASIEEGPEESHGEPGVGSDDKQDLLKEPVATGSKEVVVDVEKDSKVNDSENKAATKERLEVTSKASVGDKSEKTVAPRERDSLTRSTIQPRKPASPTNGRYKSSTDNVYTMATNTPFESAWRSFKTSEKLPVRSTRTREDDSWLTRSANSERVSSRTGLRSWEPTPNNSRSNTPTLHSDTPTSPVCKMSDGSRSVTPTSPGGRNSPRQIKTEAIKSGSNSPAPVTTVTSPTDKTPVASKTKSPTPPADVRNSRLSTEVEFRRPKPLIGEKLRACKIEARKTPVLTPEQLEALDLMIKGGEFSGDLLETCQEEDEEMAKEIPEPVNNKPKSGLVVDHKLNSSSSDSTVYSTAAPVVETRVPDKRLKDRSKSLVVTEVRETSPVFPEEGGAPVDAFSQSLNMRKSGIDRKSRFRNSMPVGLSSSLSMTDLSQIGKRENKARRVGRSNSKRLVGKSATDSYVTDTRTSPAHRSTSGSLLVTNLHKSSSKTLPGKTLSGKNIDHKEKKTGTRRFKLFK